MHNIEIRALAVNERHALADTVRTALLTGAISDEVLQSYDDTWGGGDFLGAWDDGRCVGSVGAFRFDTVVPGGALLSTSGVTEVGILPTHTRRGLLTSMIGRLLAEARENGFALSSLRASEATIYGRFGFGLAGDSAAAEIESRRARPLRFERQDGSVRILERHELLAVVPPIYELSRWRVGSINRPGWHWPLKLQEAIEPSKERHGKGVFVAVHSDESGVDDGYVHYEVDWNEGFADDPTGKGRIIDLWGASPAVELALWDYILGIDLVLVWQAEPRPIDDPIRRAVNDPRAYQTKQVLDEQWVRLLNVDVALNQRAYGSAIRPVTLEIDDPMFVENSGCWTISNEGAQRTDAAPDLRVDIATLSAAYLGGVSWAALAASGSLPTTSEQVLADLDALFATSMAPFSGTMF